MVLRIFNILFLFLGLTYNKNSKGEISWDGLANVKLRTFENASVFNHFILSFNINTNHWVAE